MVLAPVNHKIIAVHFFCHVYNVPMEIFIPLRPRPQERPAFNTKTRRAYTRPKSRAAAKDIADFVKSQITGAPLEGALRVDIEILLPVPKSWPEKKRIAALACQIWPTSRPDRTNISKLLEDALNGILWRDDSQIVQGDTIKRYAEQTGYRLIVTRPVYSRVIPLARHS